MSSHLPFKLHTPLVIVVFVFILIACNCNNPFTSNASDPVLLLVTADPNRTATPTPFQPFFASPGNEIIVTPEPSLTLSPPTAIFTPLPTLSPPAPTERTKYDLDVVLDYVDHSLSIDETIRYTNQTGETLEELVLAVEPNRWINCFELKGISLDGAIPDYNLEYHRLEIILPQPLAPGYTLTLSIQFDLSLPPKNFNGVFGYLGYQLNLMDWYPFIVPYASGQGWILHDPSSLGEFLVYEAADFEVNFQLADTYKNLVIAASAPGESNGEWTRYHLKNARTFAFSASKAFRVSTTRTDSIIVKSYYFPGHRRAGKGVSEAVAQAVSIFNKRFGPYPYASLSIVETELPDGMEADGLFFLGSLFYDEYDGSLQNDLTSIGIHEAAHNWWFGLVGNDQAMEPWLDEALALYSERIFFEAASPGLVNWWWNYRVNYYAPTGWVDTNVYNGGNFRSYTDSVYLRGAEFLEDLRYRIGDDNFFSFLQDYIVLYGHRRATTDDFFNLLQQHTSVDYSDIVNNYFLQSH